MSAKKSLKTVTNFFNKLVGELDKKFFPDVKYYRDNVDTTRIHYVAERFSNGVLTYDVLVHELARSCKITRAEMHSIVSKFVEDFGDYEYDPNGSEYPAFDDEMELNDGTMMPTIQVMEENGLFLTIAPSSFLKKLQDADGEMNEEGKILDTHIFYYADNFCYSNEMLDEIKLNTEVDVSFFEVDEEESEEDSFY